MKKTHLVLAAAFFLAFSAGVALFLALYSQASSFTILSHSFSFSPFPFTLTWAGIVLLLVSSWILFSRLDVKLYKVNPSVSLWNNFLACLPLLFFLLTPVLLKYYLNREDLKTRLNLLAVFILLSVIYLKIVQLKKISWRRFAFSEKLLTWFRKLSLKKKLLLLFLSAFFLYNFCTWIIVSRGITFSGDEPYYLLTSHSLLKDKDINLANNFANQDYFHFYSREENPRLKLGMYARQGKKGKDYIYPINLPGISVLMLPHYWFSQFFKGKVLTFILKSSLSIWAVLLGLQLYLFSLERWNNEKISLLLWALYSFTSPVIFYATHLYPEIPIALFSFYIFRKVSSRKPLSLAHLFFLGFLLSTFFWLGLKYNLIFWPLLIISVFLLLKQHQVRWKLAGFLAFPVCSLFLYYYFIYFLYGTVSPFAIYEGVMTPEKLAAFREVMLRIPLSLRVESFLDYFLDQRDGLLLYSPLYFFSFLGLIHIFRKSRRDFLFMILLFLPFTLNYAFFSHRQGYSPQGRVLASLSWLGAILIGYFIVYNRKKLFAFLFRLGSLTSLAVVAILLLHPSFLYQPTTHDHTLRAGDMFVFLSNIRIFLPSYLPSFIKVRNFGYLPNYFWVLAVIAFVLIYIYLKKDIVPRPRFHIIFSLLLLLAFFFQWCLYPQTALYPTRTFRYSPQKALGFYLFPMGKGVVAKKTAELYLHREKSYKILFSSRKKLEKIRLSFGSEDGEYDIKLTLFDLPLYEGKTAYENKELIFTPSAHYPFKKLFLYEINLSLKKYSSESMLAKPYFFQVLPLK